MGEAQEAQEEKRIEQTNLFLKDNRIYGFTRGWRWDIPELRNANKQQEKVLQAWKNPQYRIFVLPWGNRSGKTEVEPVIGFSVMIGEWPWSGEKIFFPHKMPRRIRIVGQGWETHVEKVIMPKLNMWWPKSRHVKKEKNNQGIDALWTDTKTKSTLEIMSTVQKSDVFEGWDGDLVIFDEPPPRDVWIACSRGLVDRNGRALFGATLIKEAWVYRDIIKRLDENGYPDKSVFTCEATMYDNCSRCDECGEYILKIEYDEKLGEVGICPKHGKKKQYTKYGLTLEAIKELIKDLKPEEIEARINGTPFNITSLVFPKFKRDTHIKERFPIPLDALIDIQIDFHPSKPWAVVFVATLRNGFKYVCDEMNVRGNPKFVAEEIIRRIRERQYDRINSIEIDPLSKGGEDNNIDVFSIMYEVLASRNYPLGVASKDKDVGIALVNNLLWTENEMPGIYFFRDCPKTIEQVENLMYDPETLKPQKKDDDFTECLYRAALKDTQWYKADEHLIHSQPTMMV